MGCGNGFIFRIVFKLKLSDASYELWEIFTTICKSSESFSVRSRSLSISIHLAAKFCIRNMQFYCCREVMLILFVFLSRCIITELLVCLFAVLCP